MIGEWWRQGLTSGSLIPTLFCFTTRELQSLETDAANTTHTWRDLELLLEFYLNPIDPPYLGSMPRPRPQPRSKSCSWRVGGDWSLDKNQWKVLTRSPQPFCICKTLNISSDVNKLKRLKITLNMPSAVTTNESFLTFNIVSMLNNYLQLSHLYVVSL